MECIQKVTDDAPWPTTSTYQLPAGYSSAGVARQLVRGTLGGFSTPVVEVAELLVTELVGNAVRHASGAPVVRIEVDSARIHVAVQDESATIPRLQPACEEAESGRGLVLVDSLAASWGWSKTPAGKRVWFTL